LRSAYIERPWEFGTQQAKNVSPQAGNELHAENFVALAARLGC
jgi:2-haloacid dehalogenase